MADTVASADIEARIQGEVSGQLIVGNHNVQILAEHGALVNVIGSEQLPRPRPRATPVLTLRPRRFQGLLDRQKEIRSVISGLSEGPVEIYGEPGVGKTSVLRHLAYHPEVERFQAGAVYRSARREPPADLLQSLFDAFYESDIPFKPTDTQVRHFLQEKNALVLLDDIEQGREEIEGLTNAVPTCAFVIASAERRLWGEGQSIAVKGLPAEDAVALVEREMGRPLAPEEVEAARTLCTSVEGNPLRILQEVAAARDERRSLIPFAQPPEAAQRHGERIEQSLAALPESERAVLATLAAFGGASVHAEHLTALCPLSDSAAVIQRLQQRNLIEVEDSRYRLTGNLAGVMERAWDLTSERERTLDYFAAWAERHRQSPGDLLKEADCIQALLVWGVQTGRWREVQRLGRAIEGALTLSGRWESWKSVVQWVLRASRALGDKAGEGWALHQLGTRALCLSDTATAKAHLTQALSIRESLDDHAGAAVTRHNLNILPVVPQEPPTESGSSVSVGGTSTGIPLLLKIVGSALLIGMAGLGLRQILIGKAIARPTALAAMAAPSQINLSWVDNSDNETEFRIERKTGEGAFSQIDSVGADSTTFNDTNLSANTNYVYRVRAANADGESEYSNEPTVLTFPAVPSDLSVNAVSPTALELRWTDKSPNSSSFKIERSTDGGATFNGVATVPGGNITYSDSGIIAEATYYYRVRATNASGDSGYSDIAIWSPSTAQAFNRAGPSAFSNEVTIPTAPEPGRIMVSTRQISFGVVATGSTARQEVTITSVGPGLLTGGLASPGAPFRVVTGQQTFALSRLQTLVVRVEFGPSASGRFTDKLVINSNDPRQREVEVTLLGVGRPTRTAVRLLSLDLGISSVVGGKAVRGRVTLSGAAPEGGAAVNLSSDSRAVRIPASVTINAGDTNASFMINTNRVPTITRAAIVASLLGQTRTASLELVPEERRPQPDVALASLDLSRNRVKGGESLEGKVTLSGRAPSGGALVTLSSSGVSIPAGVTVNAGNTSATFKINTNRVRTGTRAMIVASLGGERRTAALELEAEERVQQPQVGLESLNLSRTRVRGGDSLEGKVTLSGRAPSGGAVVTLSSSGVVSVPASVIVNAGNTIATFKISTNRVRNSSRALIVASLGGERRTAALELEPEEREPQPQVGLASLGLSRIRVKGGESLVGTITLSRRAPQVLAVNLSSSNPRVASVPPIVRINAGSSVATFRIITFARPNPRVLLDAGAQIRERPQRPVQVEITAQLFGTSRTAKLEVW